MRRYIQNMRTRVRFSLVAGYSRSVSWCESHWDVGALSQDSLARAGAWAKQGHLSQQLARSGLDRLLHSPRPFPILLSAGSRVRITDSRTSARIAGPSLPLIKGVVQEKQSSKSTKIFKQLQSGAKVGFQWLVWKTVTAGLLGGFHVARLTGRRQRSPRCPWTLSLEDHSVRLAFVHPCLPAAPSACYSSSLPWAKALGGRRADILIIHQPSIT